MTRLVRCPIDFYYQFMFRTVKVKDKTTDSMLLAKFEAI